MQTITSIWSFWEITVAVLLALICMALFSTNSLLGNLLRIMAEIRRGVWDVTKSGERK